MDKKEEILERLKNVIDPEVGLDVVNLGLIYNLDIKDGDVNILMTLTVPGCPLMNYLVKEVENRVKEIDWVKNVKIDLTFDPPWSPERLSEEAKKKLGWA